ncbi:hypothetical protein AALO_G00090300 [Alosa alosa]|uniref:Uncharacterized protein n=1 Tax=Alosa alosa TaxID=278164 RepID=A0AAV6GS61_9TELE|nr:hypothetical protein AALO_G00090300 [Alosa alosa]
MDARTVLQNILSYCKLSTPLVSLKLLALPIPIAEIVIGELYRDSCPIQWYIPFYLVVAGIFTLSLVLLTCLPCHDHHIRYICNAWNFTISHFFLLWLIAGTMWIYPLHQPNYNPAAGPYCDKTVYLFAYWINTLNFLVVNKPRVHLNVFISIHPQWGTHPTISVSVSPHQRNIKTELLELLFKTIDDLEERDFKRFKAFLSEKHLRGYEPIPKARLENADATEIINQMSQAYDRDGAVRITASILKKMCRIGLVNDMTCGKAPRDSGLISGQNATTGAWPWQVSLHRAGSHFCSGSLISAQAVLTAAHCFSSTSITGLTAYLGHQNQQGSNPNKQLRNLFTITQHPEYDAITRENDIAVVVLTAPLDFNEFISPVCLADSESILHNGTDSWVTGWGNAAPKG